MVVKIARSFILAFLVITTFLSCGEPLAPRAFGWAKYADVPVDTLNAFCEWGYLWVAGEKESRAIILKSAGEGFETEYLSPADYKEAQLVDIVVRRDYGWAVGSRTLAGVTRPFMLRYIRNGAVGEWREVDVSVLPSGRLSAVFPINETDCWLLLDIIAAREARRGLLVKYSPGGLVFFDDFGEVSASVTNYEEKQNIFYAISTGGKGYGVSYDDVRVFITSDEGASWAEETLPRHVFPGREILSARAAARTSGRLFLIVRFGLGDKTATGLVRRTGAAGAGIYEPIFLAYEGPYFHELSEVAFWNPRVNQYGISTDGVGVGDMTAITFDEGKVFLEELPYPVEISSPSVGYGSPGFFAIGKSIIPGSHGILYHP